MNIALISTVSSSDFQYYFLTLYIVIPFLIIGGGLYFLLSKTTHAITKNDTKQFTPRSIAVISVLVILIAFLAYVVITTYNDTERQARLGSEGAGQR